MECEIFEPNRWRPTVCAKCFKMQNQHTGPQSQPQAQPQSQPQSHPQPHSSFSSNPNPQISKISTASSSFSSSTDNFTNVRSPSHSQVQGSATCPSCGGTNNRSKFCRFCGAKIDLTLQSGQSQPQISSQSQTQSQSQTLPQPQPQPQPHPHPQPQLQVSTSGNRERAKTAMAAPSPPNTQTDRKNRIQRSSSPKGIKKMVKTQFGEKKEGEDDADLDMEESTDSFIGSIGVTGENLTFYSDYFH
jgi:hypothetical protein